MTFRLTMCVSFKQGLLCMSNLTVFNGSPIKLFSDHGIQITAMVKRFLHTVSGSDPEEGGTPHHTQGCTLALFTRHEAFPVAVCERLKGTSSACLWMLHVFW